MGLKAIDLFCGPGGAGMGLYLAGYEVVGIDIKPQPKYPFEFHQMDALDADLDEFDLIWASPPCQSYSVSTQYWRNQGKEYPDLVEPTREKLIASGKPYIIENVMGAPLIDPVMLCGTMFPDLKVFRHRIFESNYKLEVPMKCDHAGHKVKKRRNDDGDFFTVVGKEVGTSAERGDAMGIDWMGYLDIAQAIPPDYSHFLAKQIHEGVAERLGASLQN